MAELSKYPYTTVPGKLRDLLQKIPSIGRPTKVTAAWLKSAGWTSSNDTSMISVLRFVGLVGADSTPAELWDAARSGDRVQVAAAIRSAYADLFGLYPDAQRKDAEALRNFFRTHTGGGEQVQGRMVQTFQILVEFGDFEAPPPGAASATTGSASSGASGDIALEAVTPEVPAPPRGPTPGIALNVNIQLQLPVTADAAVYESLFAAMRKHLIDLTEAAE